MQRGADVDDRRVGTGLELQQTAAQAGRQRQSVRRPSVSCFSCSAALRAVQCAVLEPTCLNAALHMVKVPTVSMSSTVLKPLLLRSSAGQRKLQRAADRVSRAAAAVC